MHHLYPLAKGDPLCPLGFHPQVRWPTRCKRCFRDYKEHGGKRRDEENRLRRDDTTASSPSLSWSTKESDLDKRRSWVSSSNLALDKDNKSTSGSDSEQSMPSSWISTPDLASLEDDTQPVTTVSIKLPKRKIKPIDTGQRPVSDSFPTSKYEKGPVFNNSDSLATRVKKLQSIREKQEKSEKAKRIQIKEVKTISEEPTNNDVQFLIQVKTTSIEDHNEISENEDDTISTAGTETTDTTLVDASDHHLKDQLDELRKELETTKAKCEKLEREKSDILLRRLAAFETTPSKTTASEVLKLQQKCNELQQQLEDHRDDRKSLSLRVKELEEELHQRPTAQSAQKVADELRSKLLAAETLCEELMDENEDIKRELRDMVEQMDELQDNFREDQAVEYTSLKKELDQTTKNCRILSFKLRKAERKAEQLEQEKAEMDKKLKEIPGGQTTLNNLDKIKQLEQELKVSNEVSLRLQKELEEANQKLNKFEESSVTTKKKAPMLGSIGKAPSNDGKVSRETLTRGGSQDDPAQLLRDLQDSLEREADLREQLKFAEEEAQNLRKKVSRIEDDNESLVLQLKKMATRARSRKLSPTNMKLSPEPQNEKGDVSDEEDLTEVKLQLELSEQEASVLRKKVEELEVDNDRLKVKTKELQDKLSAKSIKSKTQLANETTNPIENQKLKVLENETNDLRKKLIEKERDCERLHAELSLNQKRPKGIQKSKSLDLDQQTIDLKRQLQVIEQEATVLRGKVQSLESENEKLSTENKKLQLLRGAKNLKSDKNVDKYIDQIAMLEIQLEESNKKIKELEDKIKTQVSPNTGSFKEQYRRIFERAPKKIGALTSKEQLKTMVIDLEKEISDILTLMKTSENERIKLEGQIKDSKSNADNKSTKQLEELQTKLQALEKELKDQRESVEKEKLKNEDLMKSLQKTKDSLSKSTEEKKKLKAQVTKLTEEKSKMQEEKDKIGSELKEMQNELSSRSEHNNEINNLKQEIDKLKSSLELKEKSLKQLKKDMDSKEKMINEMKEKGALVEDLEKKLSEAEDKYTKIQREKKFEIQELEQKIEKEKSANKSKELETSKLTSKWDEERTKLYGQIEDLNVKVKNLETNIEDKNKTIKKLEESLRKEREIISKTSMKKEELENREANKLKDELEKAKISLSEMTTKLEASQKAQKTIEDKLKKSELDNKNNKLGYDKKTAELEINLQNEKKKLEIIKNNHDKQQKNHELELSTLRAKIKKLEQNSESGSKKLLETKQLQESIDKLENTLTTERRKYDDLTAKYEILEEEHVVTKARLVMEKETIENQCTALRRDVENLETEMETLRASFNTKQEAWTKEKSELQRKIKESSSTASSDLEKTRLKASLEEKQSELEQLKKEYDAINDQMDYMRKETDELRKKLDDYQKVNKVQRNISADSSAMEKEIRQLRSKITILEKSKKTDVAECKMRYDSQLSIVNGELQSLQSQVMRFKRERDTYKHMLESAQKTIGDLKNNPKAARDATQGSPHYDELEESRTKIATLEQQISCMEDELSEARLESSKLKTELVSERSTWEVKISELHSRINELEEEKILSSGRTKVAGLRTRMELAWQKEREEQQRILQETATLARDLRQTLFEVERERDKERLEAKRKQEQVKKSSEEDHDENKRKITELQCDLLELRDAHAKLRTTNEKLRREKERFEKEREQLRKALHVHKRTDQQDDKRVHYIIEQIDILKQLAPELFFNKDKDGVYTPTPPRRTKSKSRESSPAIDRRESSMTPEDKQDRIQSVMQKLVDTTEDLRKTQKLSEDDYERERLRLMMGMRRATSTEHENILESRRYNRPVSHKTTTASNLRRKSLSLEHTVQNEQSIWKNDTDSMSSLQSLDVGSDAELQRWSKRDTSMDSRLSGGSTQSDMGTTEKKKKKGFMGKLKKLTKSRSIDDQDPDIFSPTRSLSTSKPNSSNDIIEERGSKRDLKERITGIFKRSGSSSRSNSLERQKTEVRHDTSSTQRPLMRNGSSSNVARASPSDTERKSRKPN